MIGQRTFASHQRDKYKCHGGQQANAKKQNTKEDAILVLLVG